MQAGRFGAGGGLGGGLDDGSGGLGFTICRREHSHQRGIRIRTVEGYDGAKDRGSSPSRTVWSWLFDSCLSLLLHRQLITTTGRDMDRILFQGLSDSVVYQSNNNVFLIPFLEQSDVNVGRIMCGIL